MWLSMTEKKNESESEKEGERESYQSSFSTQWPVFQAGLKKKTQKPAHIPAIIMSPYFFQNNVDLVQEVDFFPLRCHYRHTESSVYNRGTQLMRISAADCHAHYTVLSD